MKSVCSVTAVVLIFLLIGCGGNTPDDTAVAFVKALAKGDMEKADSLAAKSQKENLVDITRSCAQAKSEALKNEFIEVMEIAYRSRNQELEVILNSNKEQLQSLGKLLASTIRLFSNKTSPEQKKQIDDQVKQLAPMADSILKLSDFKDVNIEHPEAVKKLLILGLVGANRLGNFESETIPDVAMEFGIAKITPECIAEKSDIGMVDDINVIETKQGKSADQAEVKLEIIDKNGESKKREFSVEKIKDEWKVI